MSAADLELLGASARGDVEAVKAALKKGANWRYTVGGGAVRCTRRGSLRDVRGVRRRAAEALGTR